MGFISDLLGGGQSAPSPPDYMALLSKQGQLSQDAFNQQLQASRYNSVTPWGTTSWTRSPGTTGTDPYYTGGSGTGGAAPGAPASPGMPQAVGPASGPQSTYIGSGGQSYDPWSPGNWSGGLPAAYGGSAAGPAGPLGGGAAPGAAPAGGAPGTPGSPGDQWTYNQSLTPGLQQILNQLMGQAGDATKNPLSFAGLPPGYGQDAADAFYNKSTRYLNPAWDQERQLTESRLAEQGFVPGTPAYNNAIESLNKTQDMARGQAADQAVLSGQQFGQNARQQAISEMLTQRGLPLNELNAFKSGQQMAMPGGGVPGLAAPDVMGAAQNQFAGQLGQYNANVGQSNAGMNDLLGLGSLFAGGKGSAANGIGGMFGNLGGLFGGMSGAGAAGTIGGGLEGMAPELLMLAGM